MNHPTAAALLAASLLCVAPDARGQDTPLLDVEDVTCAAPALRVTRPSEAWRFVDLAAMRARAEQTGADTRGYAVLRARLWNGSARADVFVRAWADPVEREQPPDPAALILEVLEPVRASFAEGAKVNRPKGVRVGGRPGALVSLAGALAAGGEHAVALAAAFRPEDRTVLTVALECRPEQLKKLTKELKALLKKIRF